MTRMRLTVLGSTGSIGQNTLDVVARHPDRFEVFALSANTQVDAMLEQIKRFAPKMAVMASPKAAKQLADAVKAAGLKTEVETGESALRAICAAPECDAVMAAIVGAAGLGPCLAAAHAGKRLMLANKEALVVGGQFFLDAVRAGGATLLPIDSEHSAIFQCLPVDRTQWARQIDKLILTASGGPFRTRELGSFANITPEEAVAHPNWVMGRKISVDSATMMNKALEVIEAKFLFGVQPEQIQVVIHPQSVIHSMVQFTDASVVAQLGTPDMRGPIAYGMSWPERIETGAERLDFSRMANLSFEPPEPERFPGLELAWETLKSKPGTTAVLNASNEVAVDAFLNRKLRFDRIHQVNLHTLEHCLPGPQNQLGDLIDLDSRVRAVAEAEVLRLQATP